MALKQKMILILMLMSFLSVSGCNWLIKPVYVPPNVTVELAEPTTFLGWVKTKDGKRTKRAVKAQAGWIIGRPKGDK